MSDLVLGTRDAQEVATIVLIRVGKEELLCLLRSQLIQPSLCLFLSQLLCRQIALKASVLLLLFAP